MAKPRGQIQLNGKDYIIQDGSYQSKMVPLFRPQLTVEGISHEALDQYLYWVQETWDKGTQKDAYLGFNKDGGYSAISNLDNSEEGKLRLQPATVVSLSDASSESFLLPYGTDLYYFNKISGVVKKTSGGDVWTTVTFDTGQSLDPADADSWDTTKTYFLAEDGEDYDRPLFEFRGSGDGQKKTGTASEGLTISAAGKITAAEYATKDKILFGTDQGWVFLAPMTTVITIPAAGNHKKRKLVNGVVTAIKVYRSHAFVTWTTTDEAGLKVWNIRRNGKLGRGRKKRTPIQGTAIAGAVWEQAVMFGVQVGARGSLMLAADLAAVVENYELFGGLTVDSLAVYGGHLIYAGHRGTKDSLLYTFKEVLVEQFKDGSNSFIDAMMPAAQLLLVARPSVNGLWWVGQGERGSGPYVQHTDSTGRIRSIAQFGGEVYFAADSIGIIRTNSSAYRTSGTLDTGWFHGGFPERTKDWADVSVQLESALVTGQTVAISVRKEGDGGYTSVGSLGVGDISKVLAIPATHQQSRWLDMRITLTGDGTNTPIVNSVIIRYRTIPVQKRGWAFTVRAEQGLEFSDGQKETRTPETIISDLLALQTVGQVNFSSMLEPTSRKVYVSNVTLVSQLMGRSQSIPFEEEEGFVAVEVLEA